MIWCAHTQHPILCIFVLFHLQFRVYVIVVLLLFPEHLFLSKIKLGNVFWHLHPAILGQHQYLYCANFNLWCNGILKLNEIIFVVKLLCFFSFVIWWVCSLWNVKRIRKYYSLYKWMDLQLPVGINIFAIEFEYVFLFQFIMHYFFPLLIFIITTQFL